MKTIRELAAETGKSKTAVMKKIENLGLRKSLRKNGNQFVIDESQEALILQAFDENRPPTESLRLVSDMFYALREQLAAKDKLISEQQQTIKALTEALENTTASLHAAQALHAGTIKKQLGEGGGDGDDIKSEEEEKPENKNRFIKLFKRFSGNKGR